MTLENVEIERLTTSLFRAIGVNNPDKAEIFRLCETLLEQNSLFFEALKYASGKGYYKNCYTVQIDFNCMRILKTLMAVLRRLSVLFYTTSQENQERYNELHGTAG